MSEITICPMQESDLDEVLAIESISYPRPWLRQHFLDELASPYASPYSAFDAKGRIVGYICPSLLFDEAHVMNVAVAPHGRGNGVGELLVRQVLADSHAGGASCVSLEVRVSNDPAIALYKKIGFLEVGKRKKYYENGEDALIMELLFKPQPLPLTG